MPDVRHARVRGEYRITLTGPWFPRRDDVSGVQALREYLVERIQASLRELGDDVFVDVYVTSPDIGLDRALSGALTALDGQHGQVSGVLWDDNVVRQARVTRLGPQQQHTSPPASNEGGRE